MGTTHAYRPNGVIGMYGLTRATTTLLFAAAAGLVIWIATQIDNGHTGGYWARVGLVAGAGLLMAMSQVIGGWTKWGRPRLSAAVLLTAFVPVAIASLWIVLAGEPGSGWFHDHVRSWSSDIHVTGLVQDLLYYIPVLAFGSGLVFGFAFDTAGPVSREPLPTGRRRGILRGRRRVPATSDASAADEPLTADRGTVTTPADVPADREAVRGPR
jgi:hypothetical protein